MNIKKSLLMLTMMLVTFGSRATLTYSGGLWTASQTLTYGTGSGGLAIPDGSPVGVASQMVFNQNTTGNQMIDVTVGLNISGGYNGNLYAYLISPTGTLVVLMNHPGSAPYYAPGSGMNVTLDSSASTSIQSAPETYLQTLTGTFAPLGSLSSIAAPGANSGTGQGTWTLFFADLTRGGGQAYLDSWTLNLTVVPEPVTLALGLFVTMLIAQAGIKRMWTPQAK
jgi:subtilisin-like proprotein convertase family protein